jgi:hypothetical protein
MEIPMTGKMASWGAVPILMLSCIGIVQAHHSAGMFDFLTPIWVKGTVVSYERVNPHSVMTLEETSADGLTIEWTVEGPSVFQLDRGIKLDLHAGDVVEVCGFALKQEFSSRRPESFIHGHLLVMPNDEKRRWGPYGVPVECISRLEDEQVESWIAVLNTERWCSQPANMRRTSTVAQAFVEQFCE